MNDLYAVADNAIYHAIKSDHPTFNGGWMGLIPEESPLNYSDDQDWLHFLGEVLRRYRINTPGCTCPHVVRYFGFKGTQLGDFRDKLVEETKC